MKKIIVSVLALTLTISLLGCKNSSENIPELEAEGDRFTYDMEWTTAFDVLEDGTLCAVSGTSPSAVLTYSLDGTKEETLQTELFRIYTVTAVGNILYLSGESSRGLAVYSCDIESGETEYIADLGYNIPESAVYSDGKLYMTWTDSDRAKEMFPCDASFEYGGTVLYSLDLENNILSAVDVDYPIAVASSPQGKLLVYAADEKGVYFSEGTGGKRCYSDLGDINAIAAVNEDCDFVFSSSSIIGTVNYSSPSADGAYSELADIWTVGNGIKYRGGFTFCVNISETSAVERIRNSYYTKDNIVIHMISPGYVTDAPFGCGYSIKSEQLSEDEFALQVLSLDKKYDMCLLSSKESVSANMRDKGTFYPLNDIEGIEEYLDRCFPCARDIAITDEGEIWMLPIALNTDVIMYNESSCAELGLNFSADMSLDDFADCIQKAYQSEKSSGYSLHGYLLVTDFILQLIGNHGSFDNEDFRSAAEIIKERYNYTLAPEYLTHINGSIGSTLPDINGNYTDYASFLFAVQDYGKDQRYYAEATQLRACPLPSVTNNKSSAATVVFLCVNPASENLKSSLDYIESLVEYLGENNSGILFEDSLNGFGCLDDLREIYSNASIEFNISVEIFRNDFERYLTGKIEIDELITEADRKYDAYFNE